MPVLQQFAATYQPPAVKGKVCSADHGIQVPQRVVSTTMEYALRCLKAFNPSHTILSRMFSLSFSLVSEVSGHNGVLCCRCNIPVKQHELL